jgi:hypothetical protein
MYGTDISTYSILAKNFEGKRPLGTPDKDRSIILKWILNT